MNKLVFCMVFSGVLVSGSVSAGGLFGNGGVFRGSIGNWVDKHVEKPILTPVARELVRPAFIGTVGAGCAAGAVESGAGVILSGVAGTVCMDVADRIIPN